MVSSGLKGLLGTTQKASGVYFGSLRPSSKVVHQGSEMLLSLLSTLLLSICELMEYECFSKTPGAVAELCGGYSSQQVSHTALPSTCKIYLHYPEYPNRN